MYLLLHHMHCSINMYIQRSFTFLLSLLSDLIILQNHKISNWESYLTSISFSDGSLYNLRPDVVSSVSKFHLPISFFSHSPPIIDAMSPSPYYLSTRFLNSFCIGLPTSIQSSLDFWRNLSKCNTKLQNYILVLLLNKIIFWLCY